MPTWFRGRPLNDTHPESGESGGYLASTADLMIGLLFIFVILVVILAIKSQQKSDDAPPDPRKALIEQLGSGLTGKFPGIRIDQETGVLSLPEEVLFDSGSATLTAAGRDLLNNVGNTIASRLPCFVENQRRGRNCSSNPDNHQIETIYIEGHTDSVPFATGLRDNFDLSLQRARAVEQVLVSDTLRTYRNRAGQPLFSLSAYADTRPLRDTSPADRRNRRVDLRIILHYQAAPAIVQNLSKDIQNLSKDTRLQTTPAPRGSQ